MTVVIVSYVISSLLTLLFMVALGTMLNNSLLKKRKKRQEELQERLFSPDQDVVEFYPAVSWICPGCGKRNYERVVVTEVADNGGARYELKGTVNSATCEKCNKSYHAVPGPGIEIAYK